MAMNKWDGMTIGYWITASVLFTATFCTFAYAGGIVVAALLFVLLFLPLCWLFLPLATLGGLVGSAVGGILQLSKKS